MPKGNPLSFKAGEVILRPNPAAPTGRVYRVLSGLVRVQCEWGGESLTLRLVTAGGIIGEEGLLDGVRRYQAEAVLDTKIEPLDTSRLSAEEADRIAAALAEALDQTYTAVERLTAQLVKNRLAAVLLDLSRSPLAYHDRQGQVVLRVTHDELAALVGSVRESTTKAVGELVRDGLIESGYRRMRLRDPVALEKLAHSYR